MASKPRSGSPLQSAAGSGLASHWGSRIAAIELMLVAAALILFFPTTLSWIEKWEPTTNTSYGHGYLIAGISVWLLMRNRYAWDGLIPRPNMVAAGLAVVVSLLWLVALRAGIQTAHQLLLPVVMWLAIYAAMGRTIALRSSFPIGFLYFALPIWDAANGQLQSATVVAAEVLLRLSNVNAYFEGTMVHLAAGVFEIAGGCSGMHFFMVATALAALYGEVNNDTLKVRVKLVVLAAVLAMLTNWIRVYTIILAGYLTDMQHYLVRVDHYRYGWLLFAIAMTLFFLIARRLPANEPLLIGTEQNAATHSAALLTRGAALALVAMALAPAWNVLAPLRAAEAPSQGELLPELRDTWHGPEEATDDSWRPVFVGAHFTARGDYVNDQRRLSAYTAMYLSQEQGRELVGYLNTLAGEGAEVRSERRIDSNLLLNEMTISTPTGMFLIRYFYRIDDFITHRGTTAELSYGLRSLVGTPISQVVAARAACMADCDAARTALDDLLGRLAAFGGKQEGTHE